MNEIVHAHLPGVNLVHLPTPPPQIRAITDHVYFYLGLAARISGFTLGVISSSRRRMIAR
jgi:predicted component of type VI protein secretion system